MLDLGNRKTKKGFAFKVFAPQAKNVKLYVEGQETEMKNNDGYWEVEAEFKNTQCTVISLME